MGRRANAAAVLAALGVGGYLLARKVGGTRANRNLDLAALGSRLGATTARNRAQRVFAGAARREELDRELELRTAQQVADALGNMKGALMKIGQMASYLDEGLPEPIRDALAQLQHDAPPMSAELAAEVIEHDLGSPPEKVFDTWDPVPIAAASIGQVHRAITRDGLAVAVKVQYPGVDEAVRADLDNAGLLTQILGMMFPSFDPAPMVEELRARVIEELDYGLEAQNQRLFAGYYQRHPFIHVPPVVDELSGRRVLTTHLAEGARFSEMEAWPQEQRDLAAEAIFRFVFRSLYRMRAFNGDPHPGNYLFRPDRKVTFLDFGLVKHFTDAETALLERMVHAMVLRKDFGEYRGIVEAAGLLRPDAPMTTEEVIDYFRHFYELVESDGVRTFTPEYASESIRRLLVPYNDHSELMKHVNLPPTFVILQRINLGLNALLGRLHATANWRRIAEELWPSVSAAPSTELGGQEAAWLAAGGGR